MICFKSKYSLSSMATVRLWLLLVEPTRDERTFEYLLTLTKQWRSTNVRWVKRLLLWRQYLKFIFDVTTQQTFHILVDKRRRKTFLVYLSQDNEKIDIFVN